MLKALVTSAAALGMASALAADVRFDAFMQNVVGNATTVSFGSGGTPVSTPSAPLGTPNISNFGLSKTAEGAFMEQNFGTRVPGTNTTIPASAKVKIPYQAIGKALFRGVAAATAVGTVLQAGHEIYDALKDLGYDVQNGQIVTPSAGAGYTSTGYKVDMGDGNVFYNPAAFCSWAVSLYAGSKVLASCAPSAPPFQGAWQAFWTTGGYFIGYATASPSCPSGYYVSTSGQCSASAPSSSITEQQFIDQIARDSGWPDSTMPGLAKAVSYPTVGPEFANDIQALPKTQTATKVGNGTLQVGNPVTSTETVTNPDASTATKTTTTTTTATSTGNQIKYTQDTTTTTVTKDSAGNPTGTTTTTTTTAANPTTAAPGETKVCGLPDTPACKIDETGTPQEVQDDSQSKADQILQTIKTCTDDLTACLPSLPSINWTFALPAACGPISLTAFADEAPSLSSIDVCQFQPTIHDLMSLLWAAAGVFGAAGLLFRSSEA